MKINPFFKLSLNNKKTTNHSFGEKVKFLVYSFLLALAISFVLMLFVSMPMDFFVMKILHFESIQKTLNPLYKSAIKYPIYLIVLIGPFFEEILFRLGLVINRKKHITVSWCSNL